MQMEEDIANIDVNIAIDEVSKIFGRSGKNKLKTLVKNVKAYSDFDSLKRDIEILADKSEFEELLISANSFLESITSFNSDGLIGEMIISEFGTVYSKSTLATVKSIHGVNGDVYQYEVQLKSNGPMHLGWASESCVFTNTLGVGGTEHSYGFDGYRLLKSNMNFSVPYGKKWRIGNVIGCVINFTKNTIEYFNNGRSLGVAFDKFENKSTYFPALTLTNEEHVAVNIGQIPFKFPIQGAKPIVDNPKVQILKLNYFNRLELNIISLIDNQIGLETNTKNYSGKVSINNVIKNVLFRQFMSLLKIPYIVASCFVPFLNYLNKKSTKRIKVLLELMWENIPENEMVFILDYFMFCMLCEFQCTWRNKFNISHQIVVLKLLIEICQETNTRKQLIVHVLFNKIKFAHFLHIVAPSDEMFSQMLPSIYWSIENIDLDEKMKSKLSLNFPRDHKSRKSSYNSACNKIKQLLSELVSLQTKFVKTLLNDNDQSDTKVSSRILFSRQFQSFIQENMIYWRNDPMLRLPGPVLLSTLFRLSFVVRELWNEELGDETDIKTQPDIFYSEKYNFFGIDRVGGTFSYLKTKYGEILKSKLGLPLYNSNDQNDSTSNNCALRLRGISRGENILNIGQNTLGGLNVLAESNDKIILNGVSV